MQLATGIIILIAAILGLIVAVVNIWIRIRDFRRPPAPVEADPNETAPSPQPLPTPEEDRPPPSPRRRVVSALARWIVSGTVAAIAFFSGVAIPGLFLGVFLLAAALEPPSPDIEILSPVQGDAVAHQIFVEGNARERKDGESLVVLVRPFPDSSFQDYHAQAFPQQIDKRRWDARTVYVGVPEDQPGTPFKICAVITRSQISPGDRLRMLPAGPSDCVLVTKE